MRFNKFVLAFCLWFTVYAQGSHQNDAAQPATVNNNGGTGVGGKKYVHSTVTANTNAATARTAYVITSRKTNARDQNGNGTHHENNDCVKAKCAEISRLTKLANLVNNSTKLADYQAKHNLTSAEMQKLKDMAANATTKLAQLKSNTTLVNECATMQAAEKLKAQCKEMQELTKLVKLANNATALQDLQTKYNLTASQVQKIKNEAANATVKLTKLQSNSTLMVDCQNLKAITATMVRAQVCLSTILVKRLLVLLIACSHRFGGGGEVHNL